MSRRILFVDDETNLLMGLQRALRPMREQWEMEFVSSGAEALQALAQRRFDAVVSDMRMPGMSGVELLDKVQEDFPHTTRIILSGQSDWLSILRSFSTAHQFLSKPCDVEQLKSLLHTSMALTDLLSNESIKNFISRLKTIPSLPMLFQEVMQELRSDEPSPFRLGEIISQDMAMTAKLLQIVNSAAYGVRGQISQPSQAVLLVGMDTVQSMVLSLSIFSALDPRVLSNEQAKYLWERSVSVSEMATLIAKAEGVAAASLDSYRTAGLLHDVGKLVIASADPRDYRMIDNLSASTQRDPCEVETEVLGCNHAEIGAYLLGLWGLPTAIVEAVAWHHHPSRSPITQFSPVTAVHVASALQTQVNPEFAHWDPALDLEFLDRLGLAGRQEVWMDSRKESGTEPQRTSREDQFVNA